MTNKFTEFIDDAKVVKNISLVIAKDEGEKTVFEKLLIEDGFMEILDPENLKEGIESEQNVFFNLEGGIDKRTYDLISQYGSGQLTVWDALIMQNITINPNKSKTVLILVTEKSLKKIQEIGFEIPSKVELAFRNN